MVPVPIAIGVTPIKLLLRLPAVTATGGAGGLQSVHGSRP